MSDIIANSCILTSASLYNLLQYIVLAKIYKEDGDSYICETGKGRSILLAYSDNCDVSYSLWQHCTFMKEGG